jgi:four helix bundle protein
MRAEGRCQKTEIRNLRHEFGERRKPAAGKAKNESTVIKHSKIAMQIKSAKDLIVYKRAYEVAMEIFHASKNFPQDEKYSLTDQIRRSSKSVCSNLRECWAKRRYEAHFISKLTDADGENGETETWLDFALDCGYFSKRDHALFTGNCHEVGAMLGSMIYDPSSFILKSNL